MKNLKINLLFTTLMIIVGHFAATTRAESPTIERIDLQAKAMTTESSSEGVVLTQEIKDTPPF